MGRHFRRRGESVKVPGYGVVEAEFPVTIHTCLERIEDARRLGWKAYEESWQRSLNWLRLKLVKEKEM